MVVPKIECDKDAPYTPLNKCAEIFGRKGKSWIESLFKRYKVGLEPLNRLFHHDLIPLRCVDEAL